MEPVKAKRSRIVLMIVVATIAAAIPPVIFWAVFSLQASPLSECVRKDLPTLALDLQFKEVGAKAPVEEETAEAAPPSVKDCPELIGGDTSEAGGREIAKIGENCPRTAKWVVKRHPVAFSLHFQDGAKILAFLEKRDQAGEFLGTKFFRGLLYEPLQAGRARAEDLGLQGLEGAFLSRLIAEALKADAELHYDIAHGNKGFVFSFVRNRCAFASKALPLMCGRLARSAYTAKEFPEPVLEMRIGLLRLFLTENKGRIYLANGLEALINVMVSHKRPVEAPSGTALTATLRAEAFLDRVLPVVIGEPAWEVSTGFGFAGDGAPGMLQFKAGKLTRQLRPRLFKGVLAGIPHDAFAAVAAGYSMSPDMTDEDWRNLVSRGPGEQLAQGPQEGGVAIIWDLAPADSREEGRKSENHQPVTEMGVVIANQTSPDKVEAFKRYFTEPELTDECGGGTVFLAATTRPLLTRMKESCNGQSLSVLDWERGAKRGDYESSQLFAFMNPGAGMREIFLAGGAVTALQKEFQEKWKQQYEEAKRAMREDGEKAFGNLPIFAYAGNAAPTAKVVQMKGFTVKQGASR